MPTFYKIDEVKAQWNRNLLPIDFLNTNTHDWTATLNPGLIGSITVESQSEIKYAEKGIRIICPEGHDLNDAHFAPTNESHYSFTVPKDGVYIFSFGALLNHPSNNPIEINGSINILETITNICPPHLSTIPFKIGNNSEPEFSFQYGKWEIFFVRIVLEEGKTYKIEWDIYQEVGSPFGYYDLTFDLFKLDYVGDKKWEKPSYYTKPGE